MKGYDVVKPPILPSGRALLLCALLLLTSGCTIRFHTDVVLNPDDTASLNLIFGVRFEEELPPGADEGMEELDAASAEEDFQGDAEACGFSSDAVVVADYTEEDFQGIELTLTDIPIEAIECVFAEDPESPFEEFSIVREGDDYVFNGRISGEALSGDLGGQKRQVAQEELPTDFPTDFPTGEPEFDGRVQVTFPGEISEHNATRVEGNTAVWEFGFDQDVDMMAVGSAGGGGGNTTLFIIIAAVVLLILLVIGLLVARSRGKAKGAASYAGAPGAFGGPHGPGYGGPGGGAPPGPGVGGPPGSTPPGGGPGGYATPPGAATPGGGIYGAPPGGAAPGTYGGPGGAPQGQPPYGQPPQGQPPQGQPPQGQPPQGPGGWQQPPGGTPPASGQPQQHQPADPPPQPPGEGGGFDAGSTRTFRPEDLLPPEDPNAR